MLILLAEKSEMDIGIVQYNIIAVHLKYRTIFEIIYLFDFLERKYRIATIK